VTEGVAKLRVATSVYNETLSHINATRLSLSIIKRPRSNLFESVVSLCVLLSAATTELEVVDEIMRL
jgi:hypothetical protein